MLHKFKFRRMLHFPRCAGIRLLHWPSQLVRSTFIDFFKDHDHQYIRSSPVIPWNDPTLAFVNAGMNQFKPVFLGQGLRPCPRATNSQKCIRVGGKHNDLHDVGRDTYHHTFFEMLGNWSFGEYFKEDACVMAWKLLTKVYKLPPDRLYVTYFGGDPGLGLGSDLEVWDIWRSIGVPENRIIPFGMQDNFWEMGLQGPCGPCTEIHYDHLGRINASDRVNLGVEDMIELWNIVFMQYERLKDDTLQPLSTHHVDTGMGLERITAVLNNETSNYNSDLFTPLFKKIEKMSGRAAYGGNFSKDGLCLDTAYRILADHLRMTTISLADGLFPEDSHKLRRIMRRAIRIGRDRFGFTSNHNLVELTKVVAETLGEAYPELWAQQDRIQIIFKEEEENFQELLCQISKEWGKLLSENPSLEIFSDVINAGFLQGLKDTVPLLDEWKKNNSEFPIDVALKLIEGCGFDTEAVEELANLYNLNINLESVLLSLEHNKLQRKNSELQKREGVVEMHNIASVLKESISLNLPPTDDSAKYTYESINGSYSFVPLEASVLSLINNGQLVQSIHSKELIGVVLNSTNFYHEAGGQDSDKGELVGENVRVKVKYVEKIGHTIVHWGSLEYGELSVGNRLLSSIDPEFRLGCMRHHTATHLLNSALRAVTGLSSQRSSHVTHDYLCLGVRMYQKMSQEKIEEAEKIVKKWVSEESPVTRKTLPLSELLQEPGVVLLPGEVYPEDVHVLSTSFNANLNCNGRKISQVISLEPCCGTHLLNTGDIGNFCITNVRAVGVGRRNIYAVCGKKAAVAESNAEAALGQLTKWEEKVQMEISANNLERIENTKKELHSWHRELDGEILPYLMRSKLNDSLLNLERLLKNVERGDANKQMVEEMKEVLKEHPVGPVVHLLGTDFGRSKAQLIRASKLCKLRPLLVLAKAEGTVVGRATITQEVVDLGASAADWLSCIQNILGGEVKPIANQNLLLVCFFRGNSMPSLDMEKLEEAMLKAEKYIEKFS